MNTWLSTFSANAFMPIQGTEIAGKVDGFYAFLLISSLISSIILIGGMTAFIIQYKRKTATDKTAYITHNTMAEFTWSFIPFVIMMVIFYWGKVIFNELRAMPVAGEEIHVVGVQWAWNFKYKNGIKQYTKDGVTKENKIGNVEKQVMVVPHNKPVKLVMTSNDVIHSFYVPGFRNKQDVIPGRYTAFWFKADKLGEFQVFCTEYCGLQHSQMPATIRVVPEAEYAAWLDSNKPSAASNDGGMSEAAQKGVELYENKCRSCHSLDGSRVVGPTWKGIYGAKREFESGASVNADDNYLRESILNPAAKIVKGYPAAMPPYAGQLSDEEIESLIEYMKTVK
jgi:cytochrome c oxidase subunit 2